MRRRLGGPGGWRSRRHRRGHEARRERRDQRPRLLRIPFTAHAPLSGTVGFSALRRYWTSPPAHKSGALGRRQARAGAPRPLQPARRRAAAASATRAGSSAAAVEGVRAAGMEAAAGRRPRRIGHLAGQRLRQHAARRPAAGSRRSAPRCRGGAAAPRARRSGRPRRSRPRYITADPVGDLVDDREVVGDEQQPEAEARARGSTSRFAICACADASSDDERLVEHEHGRVGGEGAGDRDALALTARELVRDSARPRPAAGPTRSRSSATRRGRSSRPARPRIASASAIWRPTRRRGLSDAYGFWKTIWRRAALVAARAPRSSGASSRALEDDRPGRRRGPGRPPRGRASTCRSRDSPTSPTISPAPTVEARAGDGPHRLAPAALVRRPRAPSSSSALTAARSGSTGHARRAAVPRGELGGTSVPAVSTRVRAARVERAPGREAAAAAAAGPGSPRAASPRGSPGAAARRAAPRVYGCRGAARSVRPRGPVSTMRPRVEDRDVGRRSPT